MKLIAKTGDGYIAEVSAHEVALLTGGELSQFAGGYGERMNHTGREIRVPEVIQFANELRRKGNEAKTASATLEAFAAMLARTVPEIIAPVPQPAEKSEASS